ncbi:efflux RND transporter periplasmic adaptor subunit [Rhodoligotrophos defluvii]|uniref:efflux RND transporter periplasmic adaptor subunit n=1 Tax=Rhodoligotrophos defluvii TaxID=2561934 RepID=UPI0010C9B9DE|nr:efflux RND transporter periplasmic adaptor subunit [Rhodoligotrophos defluvii]
MKARTGVLIAVLSLCAGVAVGAGSTSQDRDWGAMLRAAAASSKEILGVASASPSPSTGAPRANSGGAGPRGARGPREVPVSTKEVGTATFLSKAEAVGSLRANQSVTIVPEAAGRVEEILFGPGQRVKAGDVLVRLDDRDQRIALEEAKAALAEASEALERQKKLVQSKVATRAALEQAQTAHAKAKAAMDRAERDLARQQIIAPFAGVVGLSRTDIGAWVDTSTVLTTLDDLSTVELEFALPERLLSQIATGLPVEATSAAFPGRTFEGSISAIDTRIDPGSRAFTVRAAIPNPDLALKPGMFVNITIALDQRVASAIPEEAVITAGSETFVYVLADGKAQRRPVAIGAHTADGMVEVVDGLSQGEQVISSGLQSLGDGVAVKVLAGNSTAHAEGTGS